MYLRSRAWRVLDPVMVTRIVFIIALFFLVSAFVSFTSAGAESSRRGAIAGGPPSSEQAFGLPRKDGNGEGEAAQPADVTQLIYRGETEFPDNTTMFVEAGCSQCDAPSSGLYRVSRSGGGPVHTDRIFAADSERQYITGFATKPDASEMVVGVCTKGYCGGLGNVEPGSEVTFYYSRDLGASWQDIGTSPDYFAPVAMTDEGIVLVLFAAGPEARYYLNSGERIMPPAGSTYVAPLSVRNGVLGWVSSDSTGIVDSSGSLVFKQPSIYPPMVALNPGQPLLAAWEIGEQGYLTGVARDGSRTDVLMGRLSYPWPAAWWDQEFAIATLPIGNSYGMTPAMVNMTTGEAWSIRGFDVPPFGTEFLRDGQTVRAGGRNLVYAVLRASYLRVATPGCAQVRTAAIGGGFVDCAAYGALMQQTGRQDRGWLQVILADGRSGWIDARQLTW